MENIGYIGLSQQIALQQQIDVTANNIANMSTPGFKAQHVLFTEYITTPKDAGAVHQSNNFGTYRDLTLGPLQQTSNKLDFAIQGEGYFVAKTPEGVRYTRDGGFSLNLDRQLVTKSGHIVFNENNNPLTFPTEASEIRVSDDGTISSEFGNIGRLKIVNFENEQALKNAGDNLFDPADMVEQPVVNRRVVQGFVESSNVSAVTEMNRMIELMRLFQATQKLLQNDHERQVGMIQKLTRVS